MNCPTNDNHHRTLGAKCPYRKKIIEEKNRKQSDREVTEKNKTYAEIAKAAINQTTTQQTRPPPHYHPDKQNPLKNDHPYIRSAFFLPA